MECAELPQTAPTPHKRYKPNGKNLGQRKAVLEACLASGLSGAQTSRIAGVSPTTVSAIKNGRDFTSPEQVQRIREQLRDKATMRCDAALNGISDKKLKDGSLKDLSSVVRALAPLAGLSDPNHMQTQINILNNYGVPALVNTVVVENQQPTNSDEPRMDSDDSPFSTTPHELTVSPLSDVPL